MRAPWPWPQRKCRTSRTRRGKLQGRSRRPACRRGSAAAKHSRRLPDRLPGHPNLTLTMRSRMGHPGGVLPDRLPGPHSHALLLRRGGLIRGLTLSHSPASAQPSHDSLLSAHPGTEGPLTSLYLTGSSLTRCSPPTAYRPMWIHFVAAHCDETTAARAWGRERAWVVEKE